ncbi:phosphonate C-P lyase system protein PhnG [Actibacterium ureilyticum]|uniref:phosphonate C-P lyase system protein PhnG n=1 Tax=Actibacterium ureilyticum TaxID=1590614 RepID=UPI000BAAD857|nr:phosphonate C-P lyase system protein PhnG [Actibacterium ureilyticum]
MTQAENTEARRNWLGLLATAPGDSLAALCDRLANRPDFDWLRPPEIGSVMVRGRTGGTGAPFNLGEMTVTRCALQLRGSDVVGHGYVQGRDKARAERAALIDALMQTDAAQAVRATVLDPLAAARDQARGARASRAAATRVEFFTMARGED